MTQGLLQKMVGIKMGYGVFCILFIFGCNRTGDNAPPSQQHSELKSFITDYYLDMSKRDWNSYESYFAEKATLTTIWQGPDDPNPKILTHSITEFLEQTGDGPDSQPIFEEKPLDMEIDVHANMASALVRYEAKFGSEDSLMKWSGYDLFSLLKFEGRWYITSITFVSTE